MEAVDGPLLSVGNLKTYFFTSRGTVRAVDDVSLDLERGKTVGLVGESGSGKTVTALSIMCVVPLPGKIVGGSIHLAGKDILALPEKELGNIRGKQISMVFQDPMTYLNPVMRIGNQITESLMLHKEVGEKRATAMAIKILESLEISAPERVIQAYPHELSGGMRQRILFAIALACNPLALILDEPTTALDTTVQAQILELIVAIKQQQGISQLLITHDLGIVAEVCDEVYVMYAGKMVEHANVLELYDDPLHPYTKALLESVLSIDAFKAKLVSIEGTVPSLINPPIGCRFATRCPLSMTICTEKDPPMIRHNKRRDVACWLYGE
jgi:oligopeptide/dipeptide ABC transporter ATP-binding protein